MKNVVKVIINALHYVSIFGVILSGLIGVVYELIGFEIFENLLMSIGIEDGFNIIQTMSFIFLGLLVITFIAKHFVDKL